MDFNQKNLKGYDIKERLGTGGFGAVYRAHQSTIGREVAIKIILPTHSNQPDFIRRFEAEAQVVARLEHPHITPLYDYWRDPEGAYLVMRWLRGGSLKEALEKETFDLRTTAGLLDQIAGALSLAHRNGIIHRDIKPANILLDEDGNAYLTDFGIAKDLNIAGNGTKTDAIIGSLDYISPEQARSEPVTARTDIYSLGVTIYEMVTGTHPFEGLSAIERLYKHINDPLPEITSLEPDIAEAVNRVIQKATQKNPEQRHPDALAFAADFREAIGLNRTSTTLVELLTIREQAILQFIIAGLSNKEIAQKLTITVGTVKWYIKQIYDKMGVRSRVQAMVRARELNLVVKGEITAPIEIPTENFHPQNPYKGLLAFQSGDNQDFFGREKLIAKLLKRLNETSEYHRFLAVLGPSGSGKSSLVKAGLIPALWRGDLPNSEKWYVVELLPGARPLDELEIALIKVAANHADNLHEQLQRDANGLLRVASLILPNDKSELVIVIDQFEEIFTLLDDEAQRQAFLDLIYASVIDPHSRVRFIVTLRADFYDRPLHYPKFGEMVRNRIETIMPLSAEELESAIIKPAEQLGVMFEQGLVSKIVGDIHYQPGALPLLQYALTELFEQRQGRLLTREAYESLGRATGALAKRADDIYMSLSEADQELTRQIFLRLVTLGEGTEDTRRRTLRSELLGIQSNTEAIEDLLDGFVEYRLLALDNDNSSRQPTVEVAHEALIREWERLKRWLNESRAEIQMQRQLSILANDWEKSKENKSFLLRGSRLDNFESWARSTDMQLTPTEQNFIDASLRAELAQQQQIAEQQARESRLEKRSQQILRALVAVFALSTVIAVSLSLFAFSERNRAEDARATSDANAVLAETQSLIAQERANEIQSLFLADVAIQEAEQGDVNLATALSLEAYRINSQNEVVRRSLNEVLQFETPQIMRRFPALVDPSSSIVVTPDQRYFLSFVRGEVVSGETSLMVWDMTTGEIVRRLEAPDISVDFISISPDSRLITGVDYITEELDEYTLTISGWRLATWNLEDGQLLRQLTSDQEGNTATVQWVYHFDGQRAFYHRPDYTILNQAKEGEIPASDSLESDLVLVDLATNRIVQTIFVGTNESITNFSLSPDGKILAMIVRNPNNFADSSDDTTSVRFWDMENDKEIQFPDLQEHISGSSYISLVQFTPDSSRIAIVGDFSGMGISVWDFETNQALSLASHGSTQRLLAMEGGNFSYAISNLYFAPNGDQLVISGGQARFLWDIERDELVYNFGESVSTDLPLSFWAGQNTLDVSIDTVTSVLSDGSVIIWGLNERPNSEQMRLEGHSSTAFTAVYSPDGRYILSAGGGSTARGLDAFELILWDAQTGTEIRRMQGHTAWVNRVEFTPDSRFALSAADDASMILWDVESGEIIRRIEEVTTGFVNRMDISPDGSMALSSGCLSDCSQNSLGSGDVRLWNLETGEEIRRFSGLFGASVGVAFTPDGNFVLGGSGAGLILWDRHTGAIVQEYPVQGMIWDIAVHPNGNLVLINTNFGPAANSVYLINLESQVMTQLMGYDNTVWGVAFSPDGRIAVAGGNDGVITLWDVETGIRIRSFQAHSSEIGDVSFSPDGQFLVSASFDGTVRVWDDTDLPLTEWIAQNRLVPEFTCEQRELYGIEPLCAESVDS